MAAAAAHSHLDGAAAVELQDVNAATAAGYLTRVQLDPPPAGWSELTRHLRRAPGSPLAQALGSPLTLSLLRDTYRGQDDARELLGFAGSPATAESRDAIIDYLLDRVIPAAYAPQPGQPTPRYDLQKAQRALSQLAVRMNREGTRDLRWWNIPRWVTAVPRILIAILAVGSAGTPLVFALSGNSSQSAGPGLDFASNFEFGILLGLASGSFFGLAFWFAVTRRHRLPRRIRLRHWHEALRGGALRRGLVPGVIVGIGTGFVGWVETFQVSLGLAAGPTAGLATALVFMFSGSGVDDDSSVVPASSWRNDLAFGLAFGLLVGLVFGTVAGLAYANITTDFETQTHAGFAAGLENGLGTGLAAGIVFMLFSTRTWPASLAFVQLAMRSHTPPQLIRFLEDARQRNVLRIIGPAYQFRHARLQDRLAGQSDR
jgi:hypothetical protein